MTVYQYVLLQMATISTEWQSTVVAANAHKIRGGFTVFNRFIQTLWRMRNQTRCVYNNSNSRIMP